jgi:hypothetical protein
VRLEDIALHLRRRSPWEALDLGQAMLLAWSRQVYGAWFATYWLAGIVIVLLLWPWPELAMFVLWWLKPLFDRVLLLVFSRSVFGAAPSVREVLREVPRLCRGPGVLSGLSLRRFSLARSFLLPVWQLEEQRGADARARFRLLSRRYRGYAVWLTFFGANMSTVLLFASLATLLALAPADSHNLSLWDWFSDDASRTRGLVGNLAFMLAETVVEPLYVASGFSLYLNRRSELEAWDIELGLRRLAERRAASPVLPPLLVVLAIALLSPLSASPPARAAEPPPVGAAAGEQEEPPVDEPDDDLSDEPPAAPAATGVPPGRRAPSPSAARQAIDAVLADPVFGQQKDDWTWRWRRQQQDAPKDDARPWLKALGQAIEFLAEVLRGLVWIVAGLGLAVAVYFVIRYRERLLPATVRTAPEFLFGLDLRPDSLPADIAAAARAALARGQAVEALSLLYRGALVALIQRQQIEFAVGDTESECLWRVAGRLPEAAERCFADLVDTWRLAAYGRRPVAVARVEELVAGWDSHFGQAAARP